MERKEEAPVDREVLSRLRADPPAGVEKRLREQLEGLRRRAGNAELTRDAAKHLLSPGGRFLRVAAALAFAFVVVTLLVLLVVLPMVMPPETKLDRLAFAHALESVSRLESVHAQLRQGEELQEIWAERPNRLRIDHGNGRYEISVGPDQWVVDERANEATKKPSQYYRAAQRKGVDVIELILGVANDDLSGFFTEEPVASVTVDGIEYHKYEMRAGSGDAVIHFQAFVEPESLLLHTVQLDMERDSGLRRTTLTVLERNPRIPASRFVFEKRPGMRLTEEQESEDEPPEGSGSGSTLTGRIVWSHSLAPVPGARVTVFGYGDQKSLARAETDRRGIWRVSGQPKGHRTISVRSWELDWPSVPTFANNVGTLEHPAIVVDGASAYSGLDFKVYRPDDFKATFPTITARIRDEEGQPLEGIGAGLMSEDEQTHLGHLDGNGQFTGPDGLLEATRAIPDGQRVRIHLWRTENPDSYAPHYVYRTFTVTTNRRRYDFDFVVPRTREMTLLVQSPDGTPLPAVMIRVESSDRLVQVFPAIGSTYSYGTTGGDGMVVIDVLPGMELDVSLKRLREEGAENFWMAGTIASAIVPVTVPDDPELTEVAVVFDERPIRVIGSVHLTSRKLQRTVMCTVGGTPGQPFLPISTCKIDEDGRFELGGVPAGRVRLQWWYVTGTGPGEGTIETRPGETYRVRITDAGLERVEE